MKSSFSIKNIRLSGFVITVSVICGALAGAATAISTNQSLERYAQALADRERLFLIAQEKPRPLPGTYEEALGRVQDIGWSSTALIRPVTQDTEGTTGLFTIEDTSGVGTVVTSDGWILFHATSLTEFQNIATEAEVWVEGRRLTVERVVEDSVTDFVLVKVQASGLTTLAFGLSNEMLGGDLVFVINGADKIIPSSIADARVAQAELAQPAEVSGYVWELVDQVSTSAPIVNSAGQLVAFSTNSGEVMPLHDIRPFVQSVLRYGEPRYAGLGARVVAVNQLLNAPAQIKSLAPDGVLIIPASNGARAIALNSPAAQAGLQANDIILAIDGVFINNTRSLASLLASYQPGDSAEVTYVRNGSEQEVEVVFSEATDLVY